MGHSFVHFSGRCVRLNDTSLEIAWGFILPRLEHLAAATWPVEQLPQVARLRAACAYVAPGSNRVDLGEFLRDARAIRSMTDAITAARQEAHHFGAFIPGAVIAAQPAESGFVPNEHVPAQPVLDAIDGIGALLSPALIRPHVTREGWYAADTPPGLELLAACLISDVQGSLAVCDEIIAATGAVVAGKDERHETGGNAYILAITRERTLISCQFNAPERLELPTREFLFALQDWRRFLEEQRKLRAPARS